MVINRATTGTVFLALYFIAFFQLQIDKFHLLSNHFQLPRASFNANHVLIR